MRTKATVISVAPDHAIVEVLRRAACDGCHQGSEGCSVCSLLGGDARVTATAENRIGAAVGDTVTVESATSRMLLYAALVFLAPLAAALVGFGTATLFRAAAPIPVLCALGAFGGCFLCLWLYSRHVKRTRCDVTITEILSRADAADRRDDGKAELRDGSDF